MIDHRLFARQLIEYQCVNGVSDASLSEMIGIDIESIRCCRLSDEPGYPSLISAVSALNKHYRETVQEACLQSGLDVGAEYKKNAERMDVN